MPSAASSRPRAAKAATSSMKKRRGELAWSTSIWMGLNSAAGWLGLISRRVLSTLVASGAGGRVVRTTSSALLGLAWVDGIVDLPAGLAFDAFLVHVVGDADDAQILIAVVSSIVADGIAVGPVGVFGEVLGEALVDHHDVLALGAVVPGEVAPAQMRCPWRAGIRA